MSGGVRFGDATQIIGPIAGGNLITHLATSAPTFAVPYHQNHVFVDREAELAALSTLLASERIGAITGPGGIGKTQLAVEYAYRFASRYLGGIFWLAMGQAGSIPGQVAAFAGPAGLDLPGSVGRGLNEQIAAVRRAWEQPESRLLIFDNLEDPALLFAWLPRMGGCRVLVTSRRAQWPARTGVRVLALGPPPRAASLELLLTPRAYRNGMTVAALLADSDPTGEAEAICEVLGDLPLALALAGAYLESKPSLPLARYRKRLEQKPLDDPSLNAGDLSLPTGHNASVGSTIALSYDQITGTTDTLVQTLLQRAAMCAPDPIPRRLLFFACLLDPEDDEDVERFDNAVGRLGTLGLLETLPDGVLQLHRLIAAYVRARSQDPRADEVAIERALIQALQAINDAGYPQAGAPFLPHARLAAARAAQRVEAETAQLLTELGLLLQTQGELAEARTFLEHALTIQEQVAEPTHPATAVSLNNLAGLLFAQGDLAAARPLYERALAIWEQTLGPTHPATAAGLNNLASLLKDQGDLAAARPLLERALAIREQTLGPTHPDTAQSLNNLGYLLQAQGDLAAARPLYERALVIREQTLGPTHPDTAVGLNNLAGQLQAQGDLAAARPLYERTLAIYEQTLGPTHPATAQSLNNLASLLYAQGDLAAARPLLERALAIYEQRLGPDHPSTRLVRTNLSELGQALKSSGSLTPPIAR